MQTDQHETQKYREPVHVVDTLLWNEIVFKFATQDVLVENTAFIDELSQSLIAELFDWKHVHEIFASVFAEVSEYGAVAEVDGGQFSLEIYFDLVDLFVNILH